MKKFIVFLLCVAVIGGGGYFGYKKYMDDKKEKIVVDVVPVNMMLQPADWFRYTDSSMDGMVVSANTQRVMIDTKKLVKEVFVEEGQEVKKGDPILEYDMTVVELELEQKENAVHIVEQDIKMANKELEKIMNYKPSEDAPQPPEMPDYPDDFEFPDESMPDESSMPEMPSEPPKQLIRDFVKPAFTPANGNGTVEQPFIINCTEDAVVSKEFMQKITNEKCCAEICVYNADFLYLYKWIIVPDEDTNINELEDWKVSDGITIDEFGQASIDTDVKHFGKLSFTHPTGEMPFESMPDTESSMPDPDEFEMPDYPDYDPDDYYIDPEGTDYVYSRETINHMITEKQDEIKQLELDLKTANFDYETAKKRKEDGKLYAEVDGIVKKIGKPASEDDGGEEEEEELSEEDLYEEPDPDDKAFAVIQGDGGVEVLCEVTEYNLKKAQPGTVLTLSSWNTGACGMAEVTKIDDTPISYTSYSWGESSNNSTYTMHARITEGADDFSINDWIMVEFDKSDSEVDESSSNSVFMPIHYVRKEGGDYYIMKADENDKLKKQYIKVGEIFDEYIEVKGGLNSTDKICFPYGKDVKEGVKTRETKEVLYPESMGRG